MTLYANVDYDEAIWLEIPPWWGPETWPDYRDWAREMAQLWWDDSGLRPGEYQVDNLALTLAMCAERFGFPEPDETIELTTYLHLPDPRVMPLPVEVWVEEAPGLTAAECAVVVDPVAIRPPQVEEFPTPNLGRGLRALRYRPVEPGPPGAQYATLRYAWEIEDHDAVVVMAVSVPDVPRLLGAADDIDEFARRITWVSRAAAEEDPDSPGYLG